MKMSFSLLKIIHFKEKEINISFFDLTKTFILLIILINKGGKMNLFDIEENIDYKIVSLSNCSDDEFEYLSNLNIFEGNKLLKKKGIKNPNNIVIFEIENNIYALDKKYAKKIEVIAL